MQEDSLEIVRAGSQYAQQQVLAVNENTERMVVAEAMVALITAMARAIVDSPSRVAGRYTLGEDLIALELQVSPADLGQVIGKQGRTARSMRTILNAVSMRSRQRFSLDIQPLPETPSSELPEVESP